MKCNLRTVNSSIRTVSEVHDPYQLYGPSKRYLPLITSVTYSNTHLWVTIHGPRNLLYGTFLTFTVRMNCTVRKKDISLSQREWNILSPTNEIQFTDRETFYTHRIWSSRSVRTERSVRKISPSHNKNEIFQVPLMRCKLRTVNSSIRSVSKVHGPFELYGPKP